MVYKEAFVAAVRHSGRTLRETDGYVTLPFGSEYSLLLKNRHTRRVQVSVSIDDKDALSSNLLVIEPYQSTELTGWMHGSVADRAFRFIQKTQEIIRQRGDSVDDGTIRVEFRYEAARPEVVEVHRHHYDTHHHHHHWPYHQSQWTFWTPSYPRSEITYDVTYKSHVADNSSGWQAASGNLDAAVECSYTGELESAIAEPLADEGITVEGSLTHQQFQHTMMGTLEANSHVILLRLRGTTDGGSLAEKPIVVSDKFTCVTCGHKSKSSVKFCSECGTYLR